MSTSTCDFRMDDLDPQEVVNAIIVLLESETTADTVVRVSAREVANLAEPAWDLDVQQVPLSVAVRLDKTRTELNDRRTQLQLAEAREQERDANPPLCSTCGHRRFLHVAGLCDVVRCPCTLYREDHRG